MATTMWPIKKYRQNGPSPLNAQAIPVDLQPRKIHAVRNGLGQPYEIRESIDELAYGPQSIPQDALPIDLHPKLIQEYQRNANGSVSPLQIGLTPLEQYLAKIQNDTGMISSTLVLTRGLIGRTVTITTTPQQIINAEFLRGYLILNPNEIAGTTAAGTLLAPASRGFTTATQTGVSSSLGVANYLSGHFFVDITAISGGATPTIILQALDPASGNWADVQDLVSAISVTGTYYSFVDQLGIATDLRIRWTVGASGDSTFSVGYTLKNGLVGTSAGISQTIYIGGPNVTTISGFPLLNGQNERFFLKENVQLWAVAGASLPLKIFEL